MTVNNFAALFNCTPAGRASNLLKKGLKTLNKVGWVSMLCLWSGSPEFNCWISVAPAFSFDYTHYAIAMRPLRD